MKNRPQFNVSPNLGIYKCFGCGESGDVISFVHETGRGEFYGGHPVARGALFRVWMYPKSRSLENDERYREKEGIYHALAFLQAVSFSSSLTENPEALEARKYLDKRGFTGQTVRK